MDGGYFLVECTHPTTEPIHRSTIVDPTGTVIARSEYRKAGIVSAVIDLDADRPPRWHAGLRSAQAGRPFAGVSADRDASLAARPARGDPLVATAGTLRAARTGQAVNGGRCAAASQKQCSPLLRLGGAGVPPLLAGLARARCPLSLFLRHRNVVDDLAEIVSEADRVAAGRQQHQEQPVTVCHSGLDTGRLHRLPLVKQ